MIYEFKVTLKDVGTLVWRVIQMDSNATFYDLHRVLQVVFDWDNYHLHSFFVKKTNGTRVENVEINPNDGDKFDDFNDFMGWASIEVYNEKEQVLSDWFKVAKDRMIYMYDFGDDWSHEITLTKKIKPEKGIKYPRCINAKNMAPEEDSRGEVLMGGVDLEFKYSNDSLEEINEELRFQLPKLVSEMKEVETDNWEEVLVKAKAFHKLKPWEQMNDEHIFAVIDPVTEERLFCSVLGTAGETFGLAVYIGEAGYLSLMNTLEEKEETIEIAMEQRSLLLSFEDRADLEPGDYAFIKTYDVPFRGRKSWPEFCSLKPGFYPWAMDDEEARLMLVALDQAIEMHKEIAAGLEIPDLLYDGELMARVPQRMKGKVLFENQMMDLTDYPGEKQEPLAISELDLQRIKKLKENRNITIEFSVQYLMTPIQIAPDTRPMLPVIILAVDHDAGLILYQNLLQESFDSSLMQAEFASMLQALNGIPKRIIMNNKNANSLQPLIAKMALNIEVQETLPVLQDALYELYEQIMPD